MPRRVQDIHCFYSPILLAVILSAFSFNLNPARADNEINTPTISSSAVEIHSRTCAGLLARTLTAFRPPKIFELIVQPTLEHKILLPLPPTQIIRKLYYRHSGGTIEHFIAQYQKAQPLQLPQSTLLDFFTTLKKNHPYNFVWLKNGKLRFADSGQILFQVIAGKHIVLSSLDNAETNSEKGRDDVIAAGELVIEADGNVLLTGQTGTFGHPENDIGIQDLAAQLSKQFQINVRVMPWNVVELLHSAVVQSEEITPNKSNPGAIVDPDGEILLLRDLRKYREKYLKKISGVVSVSQRREVRPDVSNSSRYTIYKNPLPEIASLREKFFNVIEKHTDINPSIGPEPAWSYPAQVLIKQKGAGLLLTKMTAALIISRAREYIPTGFEDQLESQVHSYQGPPLWPEQLFEMSYVLAKGDLFKALLTCHNVLATNSRLVNRQETGIHPKLAYIRADSAPLGDNFGAWYHLFGIASLSIQRSGTFSLLTGYTETVVSRIYGSPDYQEELMNTLGARLGQELKLVIETK